MSDRHFSYSSSDGSSVPPSPRLESSNSDKGIQLTIQNLQNEQERVQKKTFTNWMNTYLCQRKPPLKVENLFEEVKDGVVLLSLLEVLSGEKLPMEKGTKLRRPHHLANISTALNFLEKRKIKLVNINASSVADGKPSIVLGLVWTIILYFQIEETFNTEQSSEGDAKKKPPLAKQNLLAWAESVLSNKYGLHIKDFGKSWADGVAFNAMIHNIRPDLVDMEQIHRQQARINLEHAFSTAERELGIPRLLDPEDVDVEKPDDKSIMTYVAQFLKAYPGGAAGVPGTNIDSADKEMKAYNSLINWLNSEAKEILVTAEEPITDRDSRFLDYLGFKTELDRREPLYLKLGEKVLSGQALKITKPEWEALDLAWQEVDEKVRLWLQGLDMSLPGKLGGLGQWLYDAEKLLRKKEETTDNADTMATLYADLAHENREFFKDLEDWKQFYAQVKRAGRYEDVALHGPQFDHMSKRLESVALHSVVRQNRLDYTHIRYKLVSSLLVIEAKLGHWIGKYGTQDLVEDMLADYVNFVERQSALVTFEKIYSESKKAAEQYKLGGADKTEITHIDHFLDEIGSRWKKVSVEMKTVRPMLEEVIATWKRYNSCVELLTAWLTEGENVMTQSLEAKEEFFKDLAEYEEKHQILNASVNFLIDASQGPTAAQIRQTIELLNRRFTDLVSGFHSFRQTEVIGKAREEYEKGVFTVKNWLGVSTDKLDRMVKCVHTDLKAYLLELDDCSTELQEVENSFKIATRTAQSLVKDSSEEDVNVMLEVLNVQKEAIVKLRKEIPERMKYLKAVLPNVESLETGVLDLQSWLMEGEKLLNSHKLEGTPEETYAQLERHKAFFTGTTYQKSIMESKNKVYQKICSTKSKLQNVDFSPAEDLMNSSNETFQNVIASAKEWEQKLEALSRLWRSLQQRQQQLEEWLDAAQSIMEDTEDDTESLIRKHKMFFDSQDKHLFTDYESNVNEILKQLDKPEQEYLLQTFNHVKGRWENVLQQTPVRFLQLEFAVPEDKFDQSIQVLEASLQQQQQQITSNQNVKEALTKHRQIFQEGGLVTSCEQWLQQMEKLAGELSKLSGAEESLDERYRTHQERYNTLKVTAGNIHLQLKQLPERWKEYNDRLTDFDGWVENVEKLLKDLDQKNLSSEEYKERLAELQKEVRNMNKYQEMSKWLEQFLQELINDAPDTETKREQERLKGSQSLFLKLKPEIDLALEKSGVLLTAYKYIDNVDKKLSWLDDVQKLLTEQRAIDSLDDARAYLNKHEALMTKLEVEKTNVQADVEAGRRLLKDKNAPSFIQQYLAALDRKWKDTTELAKARHDKTKGQVKDWESYESEKTVLLTCMKKAELELDKPLETLNQESAQKDLQSKKEIQSLLGNLKDNMMQMIRLNAVLTDGASQECQGELKTEVTDFDKRLQSVNHRLNVKLTDLETSIEKWNEYHSKLTSFSNWLNEKEGKLVEASDSKQDSPETQLKNTEAVAGQIIDNHVTLENLETEARELTENFRSRESAPLQSKLLGIRRQWESLCVHAKDRNTALAGNLAHWQKYQNLQEQLMPWMLKAEKYCALDLPKCASLDEAKELYELHQNFLQECNDNLPAFEQLVTEAGYLMDQPSMHHDLEVLQQRWDTIVTNSDNRSQKVEEMYGAWSAYGQQLDNFEDVLDKIKARLAKEPNINSTDVRVLEHELAMAKALQEEVRSHQPELNALTKQFEQVQDYASPEGLKMLKSKQDSIKKSWNEANDAVTEGQQVMTSALQHRKGFYDRLQETEKWLKGMQKRLDSGSEIYSDEASATAAKLKAMRDECKSQEEMFQSLQQEFKELIAGSSEAEAALLSGRFDKLVQDYTQMEDLIGDKEELCDKWSKYTDAQKDAQAKIKAAQARLAAPDIKEEEVAEIQREIEALHKSLEPWSRDAESLDSLMAAAHVVVKDRTTQRTLHFGSELKNLESIFETAGNAVKQKGAHLGELAQLSASFSQKQDGLAENLVQVQEKLLAAKVNKFNLQGLKDLVQQIESIRDDLYKHNPEHEQLREVGRQIMASDPTKAAEIQQKLLQMNSDLEAVQALLAEKHQQYSSVVNTWQQYSDSKQGVGRVVTDMEHLLKQELTFTNQVDIKKCLDEHKKAEFELHTNQTHLDHMNKKGLQLLDDLKGINDFDLSGIEGDVDDVNLRWETASAAIEKNKANLEAQMACWDQVQSGTEEVGGWVHSMATKLEDSLRHFDDVISVKSRLAKFKEEAPYFQEVMDEVNNKLKDLQELNRNKSVPSLVSSHKDIQQQFEKAASAAKQLESMISSFSEEQQDLQKSVSDETQWMSQLKEDISKLDDVTGSTEDIMQRYETIKHLQQELASHKSQISAIHDKSASLQQKYTSSEAASLAKDGAGMMKKFEALIQRADHIESSLLGQLEQHCTAAQQQQLRWLNAAKEKVAWCGDTAGDRYSVEAKLATLKEIEDSLQEGEQRRQEAINQLDAIKGVLPKSRQGELEISSKNMEKEWQNLVKSLQQTGNKLETCMGQWQKFEHRFESLSQWLKDSEATMRAEASLKPDLASKKEQLELFRALEQSIKAHNPELEDLQSLAQHISQDSGDSRTISNAGHLVSRYQALAAAVRETIDKCDHSIDDHSLYSSRYKAALDWLSKARQSLEKCSPSDGDGSSLNTRLTSVKDLLGHRDEGFAYFNEAVEAGERLYPNTSIEGRESIRNELHSLRDDWEAFSDNLRDTQRQLDSSKMQWQSFDESFEQVNKWMLDMEAQVDVESELKATLQEKKILLQQYKSRYQGILSHQSMIDSLNDKGSALSSFPVQNKLKQLSSRYNQLCKVAEGCLKKAEDYVSEHELHQDTYQQCQHWLNTTRDKASVCAEAGGDKQALTNRLERLQELVGSLPEGETKVKSAHRHGEKTMPHTSSQGQTIIRRELDSLNSDWDTLVLRINDTQQSLMQAIKALEIYDGSCETLHRWLRDTESQFKDCELRSTINEKESQVETFKSLKQEIHSRQSQFNELQDMTSQVLPTDGRLSTFSSQLITKYESLKDLSQSVIVKWEGYVEDHRMFLESLGHCSELVDTLRKRFQVCGELVGDKHDVEDRMSKLQELLAERDKGTNRIHQTIENGEHLYSSTSSNGRDTIRHDIRSLRERWDTLCEEVSEVQHKLDVSLSQWSSYDENFESFQKWLLDTEVKLNEYSDLQTTLPERKVQLRNHKVLHQDILSREHVIGNLTEKAQALTQSAPSAKVKKFVGELKQKYATICETSRSILDKLEHLLQDQQQFEDAVRDFTDWLGSNHGRLEACADCSGDKLALRNKKDRLKEFSLSVKEGALKLNLAKKLGATIIKNTSAYGRDALQRELDHLQQQWDDYLSFMKSAETSLDEIMTMWESFETKFEQFTDWLRDIEQKVKGHDLKNTFKEKQIQLEKFKKQQEEILSRQPQMDRFTDDSESLMHTSSDARLGTQLSQLTTKYQGLLSLIKDLIARWERYVHEHQSYDNQMEEIKKWMVVATQRLQQCAQPVGNHESLEEKKALLQKLSSEKDQNYPIFSLAIESGEKLLPDTGAEGRENIRGELRGIKQEWENFLSSLNDARQNVDSHLHQWSSYIEGQDQLLLWMAETEAALVADADLKNTLQEKRQQLQTHRGLLQDITSHQRLVTSMIEKAQGVLLRTANAQVSEFISSTNSRYEKLVADAKALIQRSEQHVTGHQLYQDSMQAAVDWLSLMKDKQTMCADTMGDRHTIQNKLERLHDLITCVPEGNSKLKDCENHAQVAIDTTGLKGRQSIQSDLSDLRASWEEYSSKLSILKEVLAQVENYWGTYEAGFQQMSSWLNSVEKLIKECPLKSTLEEKEEQLVKYQELMQQIKGRQKEVDQFTDEAQTLQHLTSESRVSNWVSQVTSRYQALLTSGKDLVKHCEQNVEEHRTYRARFADSSEWLKKAKQNFSECSEAGNSRAELEDRLDKVRDLALQRDSGYAKLSLCVEAGEKLYPNTSPEGREVIRQELRSLKLGHESLFDDLSTIQRKLSLSMVQWTSFDESHDQVKHWLKQTEAQLESLLPLRSTLAEKKSQLHNYKALQQDVLTYQRVIENITDKASSLIQTSRDPEFAQFISQTETMYKKLCSAATERVSKYETFVNEHQQYSDLYNSCVEWLNAVREKLSVCSDVSGDRHTIQNRLDKVQPPTIEEAVVLATKMEGDPKVREVVELSRRVVPHTAPDGRELISREIDALKADWEAFITALAMTKNDLEVCMNNWNYFETLHDGCINWLRDLESRLRDIDLRTTLEEKQDQLIKIKALQAEVASHQNDLDSMNSAADELFKVSTDANVSSQASQLIARYKTTANNNKELQKRWEQYVLDHQAYIQSYNDCRAWLSQMKDKQASVTDTSGDKATVQDRLRQVQKFLQEKERGILLLQTALEKLQIVLPSTSVPGRDILRHDMQTLQQQYDQLSANLNDVKAQLDGTLAQWTVYDDSVEQLQRWLTDLEQQILTESVSQSTLQEKRFHLDRIKILQLNIASQKSVIDSLNVRVQHLNQSSRDGSLEAQIAVVVDRYDKLTKSAKNLNDECEKNLQDHQIYKDAYMDTSDWLGAAIDKLSLCSAVRGDRQAMETQLQKVEDIALTVDAGRRKLKEAQQKGGIVIPQTSAQGQELIREELKILTSDFDHFKSDLNDLRKSLKTTAEKWNRYGEQFEELSQWIADMENEIKSESDLKTSLHQKAAQLKKHTNTHGKILQKQEVVDKVAEQVQSLVQSSPDGKMATQLSQLGSRYSGLVTLSKDLLKKYEMAAASHEQYSSACNRFLLWLQGARDKLSACADTSGDVYRIKTQLEKLQELAVAKEEGQVCLNMAVSCGQKTMTSTSVEGQQIIETELQKLQAEWNLINQQVTDTKVKLESSLLQWSEYNTSCEQVLKWLRDMERRLNDTQPRANLSEKKAELQRAKELYEDIVSYEQKIESVTGKASKLAGRTPGSVSSTDTSDIQSRYNSIKDQAKDLLARCEQSLAHHQNFHNSCHSFSAWLQMATERLAACSGSSGDIEAQMERAKLLLTGLSEGSQYLFQATKAGEATIPSTSASGRSRIRQELQAMNTNFDQHSVQLVQQQSHLENCLQRSQEFELVCKEFGYWLRERENFLQTEPDLMSTAEEKKGQWEKYRLFNEDVISYQSTLDRVNEKAKVLLKMNADPNVSHTVNQLMTRYNGVITLAKQISNNLEACHINHKRYNENHHLFTDWLRQTSLRLHHTSDSRGSTTALSGKSTKEVNEFQAALEQGHNLLHNVLESCEKTLPCTNQKGCHILKKEADAAKADYENICSQVSQVKRGLEDALADLENFERLYQQMSDWMFDGEQRLKTRLDLKADLPEKRSNLEKHEALHADILAHKEQLDLLEEKASRMKDGVSKMKTTQLRSRYAALVENSKNVVDRLEEQVASVEDYRKSYMEYLDWLTKTKHHLQYLADYSGDKRALQDRLVQLQNFKAKFVQGFDMLTRLTDQGRRLWPQGQSVLQKEIEGLHEDWQGISSTVTDVELDMKARISAWTELEDEYVMWRSLFKRVEERLQDCLEPVTNLSRKRWCLQEAEDLYDEILHSRSGLNRVRAKANAITHKSNDPRVASSMMQLSAKYQELCTLAETAVGRLREATNDHRLYDDARDRASSWLKLLLVKVEACSDSSGDWHTIQSRIEDIKLIIVSMDEGLQMVNFVCDQAEQILPCTPLDGKIQIEAEVTELTNDWEILNSRISECSAVLEGVQQRWHEYEEYYGSLIKWLADTESCLDSTPEFVAQLPEHKTQLDKYKMIMADVVNHHRLVNELADRVANLEALCDNQEVADSLAEIQDRYAAVADRSKDIVELIQRGYDDHQSFLNAQQDCEKWLLAMSYRLMAHNTLHNSKMEPTNRQKDKQKLLLTEIEDFRHNIDSVIQLGQHLIRSNLCQARLATQVQAQMTNLEESYNNLQSTAHQIGMTTLVSYSPKVILRYL